jgi:uncharacterized membrane protein YbhN (UPF0104 family)
LGDARRRARRAEYSVVLVLVVAILGFSIAAVVVGFDEVRVRLALIDPATLLLLLLPLLWGLGFRIARWTAMSKMLGVPTRLVETVLYYLAGLALALTPARLGETARLWLIRNRYNYSYAQLGPLFIGDRLGDAVSYLCIAALGAGTFLYHAQLVAPAAVVVAVAVALLARPWLLRRLINVAYRLIGVKPRFFAGLRGVLKNSAVLVSPKRAMVIVVLGAIAGLGPSTVLFICANKVGIALAFPQAAFIVAGGVLAGGLTMLPGGVGGTEPTMFALLVIAGASPDGALAAVIIQRVVVLWIPALIGVAALAACMPRDAGARTLALQPARTGSGSGVRPPL